MTGLCPTTQPLPTAPPARNRAVFVTLLALSVAEVATLGLLLLNLAVLHVRPIAQVIGPVHGAVYLAVVMIAVFAPGLRRRDRALGFVPVVGGALAVGRMRRAAGPGAASPAGGAGPASPADAVAPPDPPA